MANVIGDGILGTFKYPNSSSVYQTVSSILSTRITPENFGAVGDGITNDTVAFNQVASAINAASGGVIELTHGKTYLVGGQNFAGTFGLGYAYQSHDILKLSNCIKPVKIVGNGAKIKLTSGLKFGSFNPVTGAVFNPGVSPFLDPDYQANVGPLLDFYRCYVVKIEDLELDGNDAGQIIGGVWGDALGGRQCESYGIKSISHKSIIIRGVHSHHHLLDGILFGDDEPMDQAKPSSLVDVISEYNARQGLSVVGGYNVTAMNCAFRHTGRGVIASSPSAGIDFETEPGGANQVQNIALIDCEFLDNVGTGITNGGSDVGDPTYSNNKNLTALRCDFVGTTQLAYSAYKLKNYAFYDCTFAGGIILQDPHPRVGDPEIPSRGIRFVNCYITDAASEGYNGVTYSAVASFISFSAGSVSLDYCTIRATRQQLGVVQGPVRFSNVTFIAETGTEVLPDGEFVLSCQPDNVNPALGSAVFDNCVIVSNMVNQPATGYFCAFDPSVVVKNKFPVTGNGKIKFFNPSGPLSIYGDSSTSYTPVLSADTTPASLGNGTLTGFYSMAGSVCTFEIYLLVGTTTSMGTGEIRMSLPLKSKYDTSNGSSLLGLAGIFLNGIPFVVAGETTLRVFQNNKPSGISSVDPGPFVAGDFIRVNGSYLTLDI